MPPFRSLLLALLLVLAPAIAGAAGAGLVEPRLTLPPGGKAAPRVALTLDACSGQADQRILTALIGNRIPATIFATARWIARNPDTVRLLRANADLFDVENHGQKHLPAVDRPMVVYGLIAAGSPAAVAAEIAGGAAAIRAATGRAPTWYRGAAAVYTPSSLALVRSLGFKVAGYSIAADGGARLSAAMTASRIARADDGDVILAHVNHPEAAAGAGVVSGILALKARGFRFVRLDRIDAAAPAGPPPAGRPAVPSPPEGEPQS